MKITFSVRITRREMFSFLMNNAYRKPMGVILFLFGIGCFVVAAVTSADMDLKSTLLLILLGSLYTIIQPIMLWRSANRQVKKNPVYRDELLYSIDDSGITVSQGESTTFKKWEECYRAKDYGKLAVIYITVNNGVILPKEAIGDKYNDFVEIVKEHIPSNLKRKNV